jgi:hypothetical protein
MNRALPLIAVLMACGGTASDPGGMGVSTNSSPLNEQAGSRLRRAWFKASDGTVAPHGWYDTTLKTRCDFVPMLGFSACVPEDVYTLTYAQWGQSLTFATQQLYSTSDCKTADVTVMEGPCAKYGIVRVLPDPSSSYVDTCGGTTADAWYLSTPIAAATPVYYYGVPAGGGQCCSCQPFDASKISSYEQLAKMTPLTSLNATQSPLVMAQISVDP